MTVGKIVCQAGKHLVDVEAVAISRCRAECSFQAVACHEHGGLAFTGAALNAHLVVVSEHGTDRVLEQCVDALEKAYRGLAELIVCGCTSDDDMEEEMTAIRAALKAAGRIE